MDENKAAVPPASISQSSGWAPITMILILVAFCAVATIEPNKKIAMIIGFMIVVFNSVSKPYLYLTIYYFECKKYNT
jgi:hypothetical protein